MGYIEHVENLGAALTLAEAGRQAGKWDLFRGQTNAKWKVTSSAERVLPDGRDEIHAKFARFVGWAKQEPAMKPYFEQEDSLFAIAQHYGLKTFFIDFTDSLRVAGFFAGDTETPAVPGQRAAIICLNSKDFLKFWHDLGPALMRDIPDPRNPEIIRINVSNLWRLQQQHGCFLWNPVVDIERFYDFDRITFPFSKDDPALPARDEIYPANQSELEKKLTHFFMDERLRQGSADVAKMNTKAIYFHTPAGFHDAASWYPAGVARSEDWAEADTWKALRLQHASEALPGAAVGSMPHSRHDEAIESILSVFTPEFIQNNRQRGLQFETIATDSPNRIQLRWQACVRHLWNGMRTLPYSEAEIIVALQQTRDMFTKSLAGHNASDAFGIDSYYLDLGAAAEGGGAYSRGTVSPAGLLQASNPAFVSAAKEYLGDADVQPRMLIGLQGRPWDRFTFQGLRRLMVEELIPTQVAWRCNPDREEALTTAIFYSPTDFNVVGLA